MEQSRPTTLEGSPSRIKRLAVPGGSRNTVGYCDMRAGTISSAGMDNHDDKIREF
jgi:hypothetical protein